MTTLMLAAAIVAAMIVLAWLASAECEDDEPDPYDGCTTGGDP